MIVCDGCGAPADEEHIRQRIERLDALSPNPHPGVAFE
jgi:hypothetical protein